MYLTHIDENGTDSPAILIENATAANRAVNIPEFVNIPPDGMLKIDAPITDYYRVVDTATDFEKKVQWEAAEREWRRAVEMGPAEAAARLNLGMALSQTGKEAEAIEQWRKALELSPEYPEAHNNLANALARRGALAEAVKHYELALQYSPEYTEAHNNLGNALAQMGRVDEAIPHFRKVIADRPALAEARAALGLALSMTGKLPEAIQEVRRAVQMAGPDQPILLDLLGNLYAESGRFADALRVTRQALAAASRQNNRELAAALSARMAGYESRLARPK